MVEESVIFDSLPNHGTPKSGPAGLGNQYDELDLFRHILRWLVNKRVAHTVLMGRIRFKIECWTCTAGQF